MFFWRIEKLKQQLAERPLSSRGELPYLVGFVALSTVALYIPYTEGQVPAAVDALVGTGVAVAGTIYVYQQNGGENAPFFLQRYFAIGWVVAVRFMAALIGLFAVYLIGLAVTGWDVPPHSEWYETSVFWVAEAILYYRVGFHARDISRRTHSV